MDHELNNIFTPFKYLFVILFLEAIVFFTFFTNLFSFYDKNLFEISLNDTLMKCYYSEKYNNGVMIQANSESYNAVENQVNSIPLSEHIYLEIKEFEVYYKSGNRKSNTNGWLRQENLVYKQVHDQEIKIQIKRMNHTIYDGEFISDLSPYINEKGRYYIHIYSTRTDGLLASIKTHISFNVIVGGGNHD